MKRLVIMKADRSGSTWFTRLLVHAAPHHAWITEEALSGPAAAAQPVEAKLQHLSSCLARPTQRLQQLLDRPRQANCSAGAGPASCPWPRAILGFSVDPTHHRPALPYDRVLRAWPDTLVVAFLRSNLVKWAVSVLHGSALRRAGCGWNANAACAARAPLSALRLSASRVLRQVYKRAQVTQQVLSAATGASGSVHVLLYEHLQADAGAALAALHRALGLLPPPPAQAAGAPRPGHELAAARLTKVTADNLTFALEPRSYNELDTVLSSRPCLRAMLNAPAATAFPLLQCSVGGEAAHGRPSFIGTADLRPI